MSRLQFIHIFIAFHLENIKSKQQKWNLVRAINLTLIIGKNMYLIYWFKLLGFPIFENNNWLTLSTFRVHENTQRNCWCPSLKHLYPLHQKMRHSAFPEHYFHFLCSLQGTQLESDQPCLEIHCKGKGLPRNNLFDRLLS